MTRNNFKELEELLSKDKEFTLQKVQNNLVATRNLFGFLGDIIELFLPKIMDVIINLSGGNVKENSDQIKYPHEGGNL
jgi:hypothetical protein